MSDELESAPRPGERRTNELQRAATQAAINYLYSRKGSSRALLHAALTQLVKTNGCTASPELCFHECCQAHDVHYETGRDYRGRKITRRRADEKFLFCMGSQKESTRIFAPLYFACVRVFGESHWLPGAIKAVAPADLLPPLSD